MELHFLLYSGNFDIICVTESWLIPEIGKGFLDPENIFDVLRYDRVGSRGGGICIFIRKKGLTSLHVETETLYPNLEIICFDLVFKWAKYRVITVYRPPAHGSQELNYMNDLISCLELLLNQRYPIFIVGDFNCPSIDWSQNCNHGSGVQSIFYQFVINNGLLQCVTQPTRGDSILDLVFTNEPFLMSRTRVGPPLGNSDHDSVCFDLVCPGGEFEATNINADKHYLWKQGDYDSINNYLCSYDWNKMLTINFKADDLWKAFTTVMDHAIEIFIPFKQVGSVRQAKRKRKYPRSIQHLSSRKCCLWKQVKSLPLNLTIKRAYSKVCDDYRTAVRNYEVDRENKVLEANNVGAFYNYVNGKLTCHNGVGALRDINGQTLTTNIGKANALNDYFSSVYTVDNGIVPTFVSRVKDTQKLESVIFNRVSIIRAAKKIKPKLTCDPDGYPSLLITKLISVLALPLSLIFQTLMSIGKAPSCWKKAVIVPFFKKGASSDPANYRPVSLTSVFCKLMERVIVQEMLRYLKSHGLINKHQHGFLAKKSTATNLLESVNEWTIKLDNQSTNTVVYVDFKKAFDSVSHSKLLGKLSAYGISGDLLNWIRNFLADRSHCSKVGSSLSSNKPIASGVVQGSCLGPILFVMFINDVCDIFPASVISKLYADDLKMYTVVHSVNDCITLQDSLAKLQTWADDWQLGISFAKCYVTNIGNHIVDYDYMIGNQRIQHVSEVNDLGVMVDKKLTFSTHINNIVAKAHRRANLIMKCFVSKDRHSLMRAFQVYVRPLLEYCSTVWSPRFSKDSTSIEAVQRRFTKRLPGLGELNYPARLALLKVDSLELRRLRADLIFVYKIVFGLIDLKVDDFFSLAPINHRGHNYKLFLPRCELEVRRQFFSSRVIHPWNSLDPVKTNFKNLSLFRKSLLNNELSYYTIF
jgi:hypothetical protein